MLVLWSYTVVIFSKHEITLENGKTIPSFLYETVSNSLQEKKKTEGGGGFFQSPFIRPPVGYRKENGQ